jgi:hypothetical protein
MELLLIRSYYKESTNGALFRDTRFVGFTIELPWLDNRRNISCIPEGSYALAPRFSDKFSHHLQVLDVPGRSLILIHPANNAKRDLEGCIAPVTALTGIGKGNSSKPQLDKLMAQCYQIFDRKEKVKLIIKS